MQCRAVYEKSKYIGRGHDSVVISPLVHDDLITGKWYMTMECLRCNVRGYFVADTVNGEWYNTMEVTHIFL